MKTTLVTLALGAATLGFGTAAMADHNDDRDEELTCIEQDDFNGRLLEVQIDSDAGGRLVAAVYELSDDSDGRLLAQAGVAKRTAPGRELDLLYIGRNLRVSVNSDSLEGLLEMTLNGRRIRVPVTCY